jgi:hypothetical protein
MKVKGNDYDDPDIICSLCGRPYRTRDSIARDYGSCDCDYWASHEHKARIESDIRPDDCSWFYYVRQWRAEEFEALGWKICAPVDDRGWSFIGEWKGEGDPGFLNLGYLLAVVNKQSTAVVLDDAPDLPASLDERRNY